MKNIHLKFTKKIKQIFSLAILATAVFVVSCEIPEDPADLLELRISTNIFTHKAFIAIQDLENQANLAGNVLQAKVTVDGPNQDILVSEGGEIKTTYNLRDGIGAFAVNPKYRGFTEPISINLEISGTDYLTKNLKLVITPEDSTTIINETILNTRKVPEGVAVVQQSAPLAADPTTGAVTNPAPVTVATNASTTNTSAEVVVPAGNTFSDAAGNPITGGDLSAQVVYFDGNSDDASNASNNSNVQTLVDENGVTQTDVIIAPVASADINMSVGSTEVKQFGSPIDVTLDINGGFINPNTGNAVQAGEEFNIYSTSDNGNWEYQAKGVVAMNNGKLQVTFATDHLSTFTLGSAVNVCSQEKAFIPFLDQNVTPTGSYTSIFAKADGSDIGTAKKTVTIKTVQGVKGFEVQNPPAEQARLKIYKDGALDITTNLLNWCSPITETLDSESFNPPAGAVDLTLKVSARCSDTQTITPASVQLYIDYNDNGQFTKVGEFNEEGEIVIPGVTLDKTYKLRVYYDGDSGDGEYSFSDAIIDPSDSTKASLTISDYELPGDVCSQL